MRTQVETYDYSVQRPVTCEEAPLYLDYNEYHGDIHPEAINSYRGAEELLTRYYRPGETGIESKLQKVLGVALPLTLVSGADQGLEEILTFVKGSARNKFHSLYEKTYDHFYVFANKLQMERTTLEDAEVVYVCCPNNPDGTLLSPESCRDLVRSFDKKFFIFDLSYLAYSNFTHRDYLEMLATEKDVFLVSSLAKMYPLAGLRAGWITATSTEAQIFFKNYVNSKMVPPIARAYLCSCLEFHDFYFSQTAEILHNRKALSEVIRAFFSAHHISSDLSFCLDQSAGNFFSLSFENPRDKQTALELLAEKNIFVRTKSHWNFLRITSVNNRTLAELEKRLK